MSVPDVDSAVTTYGAPYADYLPVEDASVDFPAAGGNQALVSIAGMTHTAVRAYLTFAGLTYTSGTQAITVVSHDSLWGNAAPAAPTMNQTSAGVYNFTWPTTVTDELGVVHTLNMRNGWATFDGATAVPYTFTKTAANTATLRTFNTSFAANAINGVNVTVYWL